MKLPNRNQVLIVIGLLSTMGPDVAAVAAWLPTLGIPHLTGLIHVLGSISLTLGGLALAWPRIRAILAAAGLATPPGAVAPWNPARDAGPSSAGPMGKQGGFIDLEPAFLLVCAAILLGLAVLAWSPPAKADPQFGGCFAEGKVCLGPSASITLGELNLATSKFSGGIIPGVGYGVTYAQSEWYATGAALYFSFKAGQDGPNQAIPSLVLSFANYVRVGTGVAITETSGPVQTQWLLLFGLGSDFGGSPKYVQAQQRNAKLAGEADGMLKERASAGAKQ